MFHILNIGKIQVKSYCGHLVVDCVVGNMKQFN